MIRHYDMGTGEVMTDDRDPIDRQAPHAYIQAPQPRLTEITDTADTETAQRSRRHDAVIVESLLRHLAD